MNPILELKAVSKVYSKGATKTLALKELSFSVQEGERLAIVGESGAGKSTLLNILGLIDYPTEGSYCVRGQETSALPEKKKAVCRNAEFGFVLQDYGLVDYLTVEENVGIPLVYSGKNISKKERREQIQEILNTLGIAEKIEERAGMLSGGQRQRVAIARALINHPKVVLADEPTSALDEKTKNEMMDLLLQYQAVQANALIVVTHDRSVAERMGRIIRLERGVLSEDRKQ